MSELGAGDHRAAHARLEALVERHAAKDNPLHLGLLHESLAHVLTAGDTERFEQHRSEVERHFRRTRNPRLLHRIERLGDRRRAFGDAYAERQGDSVEPQTVIQVGFDTELQDVAAAAGSVRERASRLLEVLLRRTGALLGYLYGGDGDVLELLAAAGTPPVAAVLDQVRAVLRVQGDLLAGAVELGRHADRSADRGAVH